MGTKDNKQRGMGRRDFLALAGGSYRDPILGKHLGGGSGYAASNVFPESRCGDKNNNMAKKILIAYASEYGSTGGVAEAIGKELCSKGAKADVCLVRNVISLSSYQGAVVGSAIYRGNWMSEAVNFVKANADLLSQIPVAYFMVCMTMRQPTEENHVKHYPF